MKCCSCAAWGRRSGACRCCFCWVTASSCRSWLDRRVLLRNVLELGAILCYMLALTNMPIADSSALGQITPMLVLLGASVLFREKIGGVRMALIGTGFVGALMIAQPTLSGDLDLCAAGAGQRGILRGARYCRAAGGGGGAGADRRDLGGAGGAGRGRGSASAERAVGDAGAAASAAGWRAPGRS